MTDESARFVTARVLYVAFSLQPNLGVFPRWKDLMSVPYLLLLGASVVSCILPTKACQRPAPHLSAFLPCTLFPISPIILMVSKSTVRGGSQRL